MCAGTDTVPFTHPGVCVGGCGMKQWGFLKTMGSRRVRLHHRNEDVGVFGVPFSMLG